MGTYRVGWSYELGMKTLCVGLVLLCAGVARAQGVAAQDGLYKTVASLDAQLFDAYNRCDLEKLGNMVADDLEFYHDKTGLAVGKGVFLKAIKENICGKVKRELTAGTLEVHPLNGYGAMEIGSHRFLHPANPSDGVGEAKFVMLWQEKGGVWKLTRVISYDHGSAK